MFLKPTVDQKPKLFAKFAKNIKYLIFSSEDLLTELIIEPWIEKLPNKESMQVFMDKYFESVFDTFKDCTNM
jgi:hypothetical protein